MKNILFIIGLSFGAVAGATTVQFQGYYYNYTGERTCTRLPAVMTLTLTDEGSEVVIEAPGASCAPPVFYNASPKKLAGMFSYYAVTMDASSPCSQNIFKNYKLNFNIMDDGSIYDPIVREARHEWGKTLFEVKSHSIFGNCY